MVTKFFHIDKVGSARVVGERPDQGSKKNWISPKCRKSCGW